MAKNQNGKQNPPMLYKKPPKNGPTSRAKPVANSVMPMYCALSLGENELIMDITPVLMVPNPMPHNI